MRRALLLVSLGGRVGTRGTPEPEAPGVPPPGPPPYQMRVTAPAGDRLASGRDGAALFSNLCGACHLAGGMGTNMLTKQRVMLGEPSAKRAAREPQGPLADLREDRRAARQAGHAEPDAGGGHGCRARCDRSLFGEGRSVSITRRSLMQGALVAAAAASAVTARELKVPPAALLVYDSRLPQSRAFSSCHSGRSVDLAREHANLWRTLRSLRSSGTVVGLTCWSDYVQARALLEERRRRLRTEARCDRLFYWEMARVENAGAQALSRGV